MVSQNKLVSINDHRSDSLPAALIFVSIEFWKFINFHLPVVLIIVEFGRNTGLQTPDISGSKSVLNSGPVVAKKHLFWTPGAGASLEIQWTGAQQVTNSDLCLLGAHTYRHTPCSALLPVFWNWFWLWLLVYKLLSVSCRPKWSAAWQRGAP